MKSCVALLSGDAGHTEVIKDILDSVTWGGLELILRGASNQGPPK